MIAPRVAVHLVGAEQEPVVVIENFAPDPLALRRAATERPFGPTADYYPGVKAEVDEAYLKSQGTMIDKVLREVFAIEGGVSILDVSYALVTCPAGMLTIEQRLPHVDGLEPGRFALVHYLVPQGCDGTSFYRHRSTGFETVDAARSPAYFAALDDDIRAHGLPPLAFLVGQSPLYDRTGHFDGSYNRALIYRGRMLHCGAISAGPPLSPDPLTGRLTITGFFAAT